jgi:hypothetical protein
MTTLPKNGIVEYIKNLLHIIYINDTAQHLVFLRDLTFFETAQVGSQKCQTRFERLHSPFEYETLSITRAIGPGMTILATKFQI